MSSAPIARSSAERRQSRLFRALETTFAPAGRATIAGFGVLIGLGDRVHLASNAGWLFFTPTPNALYSRAAPPAVNATLMGANALPGFLGSLISGRLGGLYEDLSASLFWSLHAALVGPGGVSMLLMGARLRREFAGGVQGHSTKTASQRTIAGSETVATRLSREP